MTDCNVYEVQRGDTLSEIGEWFHVPWRQLAEINHIQNPDVIHPDQKIQLTEHGEVCHVYTVRSGDTLSEIGQRFGVRDWRKLAHYNHIRNPDVIHPGQHICIPQ